MARQDRAPRDGGARSSIYDDITSRIIAELEAGIRKHKEFFRVDTSYTQEDLKLWALLP